MVMHFYEHARDRSDGFAYLYDKTEEPSVCFLVHQILVPH